MDDAKVNLITDNSLLNDDLLVESSNKVAMSKEIVKVAGLLSSAIVIEALAVAKGGDRRLSGKVLAGVSQRLGARGSGWAY